MRRVFLLLVSSLTLAASYDDVVHYKGEKFFKSVKQLTFGGANAEAYFSFDNKKLTYQAMGHNYGTNCDQIYELDLDQPHAVPRRISTGVGVCTCSFFLGDNRRRLYAGTFHNVDYKSVNITDTCPRKRCSKGNPDWETDPELKELCSDPHAYYWDIHPEYDIFVANEYGNILERLTDNEGYDAEGVVSPDGSRILYTSEKAFNKQLDAHDLELFVMDVDGSNDTQLTDEIGYDGGAFFSQDGKKVVFRASRPNTTAEIAKYKKLLKHHLVEPLDMEIFTIDLESGNTSQITHLGGANWAPYYLNDNHHIIFSSNHLGIKNNSSRGFEAFSLFTVDDRDGKVEQVTFATGKFDAFPMQSYDGKWLVFGSSRNSTNPHEVNLFLAEWNAASMRFALSPLSLLAGLLLFRW